MAEGGEGGEAGFEKTVQVPAPEPDAYGNHGRLKRMGLKQWRLFTIIPIGRAAACTTGTETPGRRSNAIMP